jgi:type I restriction enzyme S subunit
MVMSELLERRLSRLPADWRVLPLGDLPGVHVVGYGITRPGEHADDGVGMIRAADVQHGYLRPDAPRKISHHVHEANKRSQFATGDIVVVLVGRVGDAAVVSPAFHGWNAARTIGIIRVAEPDDAAWLQVWLGSPEVRDWCERRATGSTRHRTLALKVLRDLPVPLPPLKLRSAFLRGVRLLDEKILTNHRIFDCATALTRARFVAETGRGADWPEHPLDTLVTMRAGVAPRPHPDHQDMPESAGVTFVTPADVLQSGSAHLYGTEHRIRSERAGVVCGPDSLLLASREDGVRAVLSTGPVVPGRNVLVLRPSSTADAYWLLHDIRLRSAELAVAAQGSAGREISRRLLGATTVRWPPHDVRQHFAELADRLRERPRMAQVESEKLGRARGQLLGSFLSETGSA